MSNISSNLTNDDTALIKVLASTAMNIQDRFGAAYDNNPEITVMALHKNTFNVHASDLGDIETNSAGPIIPAFTSFGADAVKSRGSSPKLWSCCRCGDSGMTVNVPACSNWECQHKRCGQCTTYSGKKHH